MDFNKSSLKSFLEDVKPLKNKTFRGFLLTIFTASTLMSEISSAYADAEFQIQCPGRPTMTILRAEYGLSMLMWQKHFLLASGEKVSRLKDGDKVSITQFRNGDELIRDRANSTVYFDYEDTSSPVECDHTSIRDVPSGIPTPYEPGRKP